MSHIYNYKPSPIDNRDYQFHLRVSQFKFIPTRMDLRGHNLPDVLDQGDLGSCVANACSNAMRLCLRKQKSPDFQPSRLFIYYFTRLIDGSVNEDSGCFIRDAMKTIHTYGACSENNWPYNISKFRTLPSNSAVRAAQQHIKDFTYLAITQNLNTIKNALAQGFPIIFGINVYSSQQTPEVMKSGDIPMPNLETEENLGGHCVLLTGYDDRTKLFTFMNSWGTTVGKKGFFTIPYDYVLDSKLSSDFWTVKFFK